MWGWWISYVTPRDISERKSGLTDKLSRTTTASEAHAPLEPSFFYLNSSVLGIVYFFDSSYLCPRKRRNKSMLAEAEDDDPMSVVSNLFDVAMVFVLALMLALVSRYNMTEMFSQEDFTMVKNPGKDNMEIITKEGQKINRYTPSDDQSNADGTKGKRVGVAYELDNGEIIYVPE